MSTKLVAAADALIGAYRQRYAKPSTEGIRSDAPLRQEVGELKIAADAARSTCQATREQRLEEALLWTLIAFRMQHRITPDEHRLISVTAHHRERTVDEILTQASEAMAP